MINPLRTIAVYSGIIIGTLIILELGSYTMLVGHSVVKKEQSFSEATLGWLDRHPLRLEQIQISTGFDPLTQNMPVANSRWDNLKINQFGYIDNGHDDHILNQYPSKPEGVTRIAIFGGSSAAGITANNNSETIAATLERLLNADTVHSTRFQVLNFGTPGNYLFNELTRYVSQVTHLQPDIVVFFDGYNDAFYASFEHVRQHLDMPIMNWADYSYATFDTWNNLVGYRASNPPPLFTYTFLLAQQIFEKYFLAEILLEQRTTREASYKAHNNYRMSKYFRQHHPFYGNAIYENLNFMASYHIKKPRVFLAYLQASPLEFKDLSAEQEAGIKIRSAPIKPEANSRVNSMFVDIMKEAFRSYAKIYAQLDNNFRQYPNIKFFDIRRIFENTKERVFNDIIHTNAIGNEIIARRMYHDIVEVMSLGLELENHE